MNSNWIQLTSIISKERFLIKKEDIKAVIETNKFSKVFTSIEELPEVSVVETIARIASEL